MEGIEWEGTRILHWPIIELRPPAWQARSLPLNHQCLQEIMQPDSTIVKTGWRWFLSLQSTIMWIWPWLKCPNRALRAEKNVFIVMKEYWAKYNGSSKVLNVLPRWNVRLVKFLYIIFFSKMKNQLIFHKPRPAEALPQNNTRGTVVRSGRESNPTDQRERPDFFH